MVAYYLLTMLGRAFSSMPGLASSIASQIRSGEIKKFLVQPVDLLGFLFLSRVAHKLAYYSWPSARSRSCSSCAAAIFEGLPDAATWAAFIASLLMSFLIGFFLEATLGLVGFWFLEVSSLLFVYMLLSFFLSGHMFPLDMLPSPWHEIVDVLPLKYLAYFPSAVFLGKIPDADLVYELCLQFAWLVIFIAASRIMLRRGYKQRYSGFGG